MVSNIPFWFSFNLQNSNSPLMEFLIFFHDTVMIIVIMILLNLMINFIYMLKMKFFCNLFPESQSLEDFWLSIPIIFLFFIGFPSVKNLYMCEEYMECDINFKIIGHQWYWSYENNIMKMNFDSILNKDNFNFRLIQTFNHLILPMKMMLRLMISSEDVIHSWSIPSIGIKMDAVPGRISQFITMINRPGMMIGQCSEICGSNHSFMPIMISVNSLNNFIK